MILLCRPDELAEGQSRGFRIDKLAVLAVRKRGQVHVYRNRCPHREIPLEWEDDRFLDDSGNLLRCAHHGALFLIESGECIQGPCFGEVLEALECREDERGIWVERA
ncbi:Rieske [2Fe-2S] domain protein [compost metagenome]|uniref:Ferredoxin subunit of nitrite reductase or a ring-hydroxylating dioxygenase n=1 Tax=Pseudomonas jinjuensis TaxID=198616 RepID=A0A1H0GQ16_9PSED|nr:Rieske 2Fe-2S domain-containing protein [Pseudomonas jinjuensis]SDO08948.1 Ferredoxin subunit of nitrite reductase or a ring-hydroxylating dioxygenase [Pseudomonas jinjuensis]